LRLKRKQRVAALPGNLGHPNLHNSDFRKLKIKAGSIDLILTDVMWTKEAVDDWEDLAKLARRWLKKDGLFATVMGQTHLAELISVFSQYLNWQWCLCLQWSNGQLKDEVIGMRCRWRPVPVFGRETGMHWFGKSDDYIPCGPPEKDWHEYQLAVGDCKELVKRLSVPGATILDPCMGSGSMGVACLELGDRRFTGCDIDPDAYKIACHRMKKAKVA
jgi:site-specific DNA-methyltransferase (adenine-specific)